MSDKLKSEQARFLAPNKPAIELFDLRNDPFEIHNVAGDPKYAKIKETLLDELNNWRKNVILDQDVTEEFRAENIFPDFCPTASVGEWVTANEKNYDFNKYSWPVWHPTRTLEEWEKARDLWIPYLFREPTERYPCPKIAHTSKAN